MDKKELRIVFMGNPEFAVESLRRIVEGGYNVVGVVTMPDKVGGRGNKVIESDVKKYAVEAGIKEILQPEKLKDAEFLQKLASLKADLFIVIAFRMLPREVWGMPPLGTFNLHASLLPKYRGAAPLNWAVINGDTTTGVTTFFLKHELDTGDVIDRCSIEVAPDENVGSVHDRLMMIGGDLVVSTIDRILSGELTTTRQSELEADTPPSPAPKIYKDTCHIDWERADTSIHNLVRGLSPYPGAWSALRTDDGRKAMDIKIYATSLTDIMTDEEPGTVRVEGGRMFVATGSGRFIEILSLQAPGKKRMEASDFLRGQRWDKGIFLPKTREDIKV